MKKYLVLLLAVFALSACAEIPYKAADHGMTHSYLTYTPTSAIAHRVPAVALSAVAGVEAVSVASTDAVQPVSETKATTGAANAATPAASPATAPGATAKAGITYYKPFSAIAYHEPATVPLFGGSSR